MPTVILLYETRYIKKKIQKRRAKQIRMCMYIYKCCRSILATQRVRDALSCNKARGSLKSGERVFRLPRKLQHIPQIYLPNAREGYDKFSWSLARPKPPDSSRGNGKMEREIAKEKGRGEEELVEKGGEGEKKRKAFFLTERLIS